MPKEEFKYWQLTYEDVLELIEKKDLKKIAKLIYHPDYRVRLELAKNRLCLYHLVNDSNEEVAKMASVKLLTWR